MDSAFHSALPSMHGNHKRKKEEKKREKEYKVGNHTSMKTNTVFPPHSLFYFTLYRTPDLSLYALSISL